jgi:hypothetical protein
VPNIADFIDLSGGASIPKPDVVAQMQAHAELVNAKTGDRGRWKWSLTGDTWRLRYFPPVRLRPWQRLMQRTRQPRRFVVRLRRLIAKRRKRPRPRRRKRQSGADPDLGERRRTGGGAFGRPPPFPQLERERTPR